MFLGLLYFDSRGNCFERGRVWMVSAYMERCWWFWFCLNSAVLRPLGSDSYARDVKVIIMNGVCLCLCAFERDDWVPALSLTPYNSGTEKHASCFSFTFISRQNSCTAQKEGHSLSFTLFLSLSLNGYICIYACNVWVRVSIQQWLWHCPCIHFLSEAFGLPFYFCQYTSLMLIKQSSPFSALRNKDLHIVQTQNPKQPKL